MDVERGEQLARDDPRALEAREQRDTYLYFGCKPGEPSFRYDLADALQARREGRRPAIDDPSR